MDLKKIIKEEERLELEKKKREKELRQRQEERKRKEEDKQKKIDETPPLEKLKKEYKTKIKKYFFMLAFPNICIISAIVLMIIGVAGFSNSDGSISDAGIIIAGFGGPLYATWFFYNFFAAYFYNKYEGIEDSSYTYNTGRVISTTTYDSATGTTRTTSEKETVTEGGGEYFGTLLGISFGGLIWFFNKWAGTKSKYKKDIYNLYKENKIQID